MTTTEILELCELIRRRLAIVRAAIYGAEYESQFFNKGACSLACSPACSLADKADKCVNGAVFAFEDLECPINELINNVKRL